METNNQEPTKGYYRLSSTVTLSTDQVRALVKAGIRNGWLIPPPPPAVMVPANEPLSLVDLVKKQGRRMRRIGEIGGGL